MKTTTHVTINRKIVVNGVEYHSVDELPPEIRAAYEKAVASQVPPDIRKLLDEKQDGGGTPAMRWILAGLFGAGAIAGYLWLQSQR
jgi:hypothetical protein